MAIILLLLAAAVDGTAASAEGLATLDVVQVENDALRLNWRVLQRFRGKNVRVLLEARQHGSEEFELVESARPSRRQKHVIFYIGEDALLTFRLRLLQGKRKVLESIEKPFRFYLPRTAPAEIPLGTGQSFCRDEMLEDALSRLNTERAGLPQLESHPQLAWAARAFAVFIATNGFACPTMRRAYVEMTWYKGESWDEQNDSTAPDAGALVHGMMQDTRSGFVLDADMQYAGIACVQDAAGDKHWVIYLGDKW